MLMLAAGVVACAVAVLPSAAYGHVPGVVLKAFGTASIDGLQGSGEWDTAATLNFTAGTTPATLFVMNDRTNLYVAVRVARPTSGKTSLDVVFDNDHESGELRNGNDALSLSTAPVAFRDEFATDQACAPQWCWVADTTAGGTNDGSGAVTNNGAVSFYEFAHPLDSADDRHDFSLTTRKTVGFAVFFEVCDTTCVDTRFPGPGDGDIVVSAQATTLELTHASGTYRGSVKLTAVLKSGAAGIENKPITFSVNGGTAGNATTDGTGTATLPDFRLQGTDAGLYATGIVASFSGDAGYDASGASAPLTVAKAQQSISFGRLANKKYGAPDFRLRASSTSGLPVRFAAHGRCRLRHAVVHVTGVGSCTITAAQGGSANYEAARSVTRSFKITSQSR